MSDAMVRDLAQGWFRALEALVRHAERPGAGGRTPSDLPLVALTQDEIDEIERQYPRSTTSCRWRRLQEGLLFHALYDAQGPDVYTIQLELEPRRARSMATRWRRRRGRWSQRHANLRAGFRHAGLEPARAGHRAGCRAALAQIDLSVLDEAAARAQRLDESSRRIAPSASISPSPPLIRFALIRLAAGRAPAGPHRPSHPAGRLVAAGAGAGTAHALCASQPSRQHATATRCRAPTPYRDYLAWIAAAGPCGGGGGLAGGAGRAGGADLSGAARARPRAARARAGRADAERRTHRGADPAGARAGADAQQLHPGRLGHPARPADRARRRGVRRHGGGPAAGDCRHRDAWWGCSSTRCRCGFELPPGKPLVALLRRPAGQPVAADGAPASGAGRDPGRWPAWANCSTR